MNLNEEINRLENARQTLLPVDRYDDGTFGTDGSHEALLGVYQRAFDKAERNLEYAIALLKTVTT